VFEKSAAFRRECNFGDGYSEVSLAGSGSADQHAIALLLEDSRRRRDRAPAVN